ncbi:MAG: cob(I)yrinic acid a,c-diamide adenosyltransferase, partial [bacterium]|nr:cob(I)yrinic acid a,c-diamide adenosyltransferase [bacterium]
MILLFYGDGKGKTSAAIGTTIRLIGYGKKVLFVQFMKKGASGRFIETSEIKSLKKIKNIKIIISGSVRWVI